MYLKDLAEIIYKEGTASEDVPITVITYYERDLWKGKAVDLQYWYNIDNWIVVEILIDHSIPGEEDLPIYNKGKIIKVI